MNDVYNHKNDLHFTKECVVDKCLDDLDEHTPLWRDYHILEPSAGDGAFKKRMGARSISVEAIDVKPMGEGIKRQNFFDYDYPLPLYRRKKLAIIGNPPFGKRSVGAFKFLRKAFALEADIVAFILPKKVSIGKIEPSYTTCYIGKLPDDAFLQNGKEKNVPTFLCIYKRKTRKPIYAMHPCRHFIDMCWSHSKNKSHDFDPDLYLIGIVSRSEKSRKTMIGKTRFFYKKSLESLEKKPYFQILIKHKKRTSDNGPTIEEVERILMGIDWFSKLETTGAYRNINKKTVYQELARGLVSLRRCNVGG